MRKSLALVTLTVFPYIFSFTTIHHLVTKVNFLKCVVLILLLFNFSASYSQNTANTRNPWGMNQAQYDLFENTTISAVNAYPGTHPTYGALPLPEVSYYTNYPDNGPSPNGIIAQFRFQAAPSHYLKDDPIVFPNQPGASHLHMFFGNTRADAYSEVGTGTQNDLLVYGGSTVQGGKGANASSYWMPALVDGPMNGCANQRNIILPDVITVYYKSRRTSELQIIPQGLEIIGGNLPQTAGGSMVHGMTIQNAGGGWHREAAMWGFYDPAQGLIVDKSPTIPQTNPGGYTYLRAAIGFPQCFATGPNGGFLLSSSDNLSHQHMNEDNGGWNRDDLICPSSHPNRIPKIEILVDFRWPANGDVSGWRLSSDMGAMTAAQVANPGGSLHGDIMLAWNDMVQQAWKDECMDPNDPRNCSQGQTGHPWVLDKIENSPTITNQIYYGNPYLPDPYDCATACPPVGTACNDNNPSTINDVEDGNCNCAGSCPSAGTACNDGNPNTINDVQDGNCNCSGQLSGAIVCDNSITPVIDGYNNEWSSPVNTISNNIFGTPSSASDLSSSFQLSWDNNYLYVFGTVQDDDLNNDSAQPWHDDSFELYIDGGNEKQNSYDANDHLLLFRYNDTDIHYTSAGQLNPQGVDFQMAVGSNSYNIEIRLAWSFIGVSPPSIGDDIGIDIHVNDDDFGGSRDKKIGWFSNVDNSWFDPSTFKSLSLTDCTNCVNTIGLFTNSIPTDLYHAAFKVEANQALQNGSNVNFYAGDHIHLMPGFTVNLGSEFLADINPCN